MYIPDWLAGTLLVKYLDFLPMPSLMPVEQEPSIQNCIHTTSCLDTADTL